MSRSKNSRKGIVHRHGKRHSTCVDGPTCPYCARNFKIAEIRQKLKDTDV